MFPIPFSVFFSGIFVLFGCCLPTCIHAFSSSSWIRRPLSPPFRAKIRQNVSLSSFNQHSLQDLVTPKTGAPSNFTRFPQTWVPMVSVFELDGTRPNSITFLGQEYIVYQNLHLASEDPMSRGWVVMDPTCPHRLAPLREGRIDPETQSLQCSYHGWTFNSTGQCTMIPQLMENTTATLKVLQNPACHVQSYPCLVEKNILWAWLWPSSQDNDAALIESNLPEYFLRNIAPNTTTYTRLLPYSYDILVENILDISHVPFAHHSLQGTRADAVGTSPEQPVTKPVIQSIASDRQGIRFSFQDQTMKLPRIGTGVFRAPYVIQYDAYYNATETKRTFNLTTILIPVQPGWSRIIIFGGPEKQSSKPKKSSKIPLTWKIFRLLPYWLLHQLSSRFLDSDLMILHEQERRRDQLRQWNRSRNKTLGYFMPSPADKTVVALRQWMAQFALAVLPPEEPLAVSSVLGDEESSFDRYHQHTRQCKHCNDVIEFKLPKWRKYTYGALCSSIVLWNRHITFRLAAVGCIFALRAFLWIDQTMRRGEFHHYKNH